MLNNQVASLVQRVQDEFSGLNCILMEVCGTHTNVIRKAGIHRLLPAGVRLLSGPGCPVCVTGSGFIEQAIALSRRPRMIIATFGDLLKVPGNLGTLTGARAEGSQIRVVYSPLDAVELARANPNNDVVFLGVGFETTAPAIVLAVKEAWETGLRNFSVLPALKILNPALRALLADPGIRLHGLIAPGHLSVITGAGTLEFVPREYHLPTVITGFQMGEIWLGLASILTQIKNGIARLENCYTKVVSVEGNQTAKQLIHEFLSPETAEWRGLGVVPGSGFGFHDKYREFDARVRYQLEEIPSEEPPGCLCGPIILGKAEPEECGHFAKNCTPEHPIGPCMVSSEGVCAAHYYYRA
jgi:hydrogenase expression/formation protein HypD